MRRFDFVIACCVAVLIGGLVWTIDLPQAQPTVITPVVSAGTLGAGFTTNLLPVNPTRRSIRICNTGATNNVWLFASGNPVTTTPSFVSSYVLAAVSSNVITCYVPPTGAYGASNATVVGPTAGWWAQSTGGTTVSVEEW